MKRFILKNNELEVHILDYGATVDKIYTKDRSGKIENVLLSFDSCESLKDGNGLYLNAFVGPIAGRIKDGKFDDKTLTINNGTNHLHGGISGASFKTFEAIEVTDTKLVLQLTTDHKQDGYEGTYTYTITYELQGNCFMVEDDCVCDKETLLYPTHHFYFNLSGNLKTDVTKHQLTSNIKEMMYLDASCAPMEIKPVDDAFGFSAGKVIQEIMESNHPQLKDANGLDHPFILNGPITLTDSSSGRSLSICSDARAIVLYNSNYIDDTSLFDGGIKGYPHLALAMETQNIPNGYCLGLTNKTKHYHQKTSYTFTVLTTN